MPKFGLYTMSGDFLNVSSTSLESIEEYAKGFSIDVQIGETYVARSPWNPKKMTEHVNLFKTIRNVGKVCKPPTRTVRGVDAPCSKGNS